MLRILSWNIWCDGNFEEIRKFLAQSAPDIICLQEVLPRGEKPSIIDFLAGQGYQYAYAPSMAISLRGGGRSEIGNAIFSRRKIIESKIHILSGEPKRNALQAKIDFPSGVLNVFSTHLVHTHQKNSDVQNFQIDNLIKVLPTQRTIVAGDFNAISGSYPIEKMRERLNDADSGDSGTWSVYPEGCKVCRPTGVNIRLDYIFTSRDLNVTSARVEDAKGSDHLPVAVSIEM